MRVYEKHGIINYSVDIGWFGFWWQWWTPAWHEGRGTYISIGAGIIRFCRGY